MKEDDYTKLIHDLIDPLTEQKLPDLPLRFTQKDRALNLAAGFPLKPLEEQLKPVLKKRLEHVHPDMHLNFAQFIQAHRTQLPGKGLRGIKNTLAIASGKGGVGKSTVAVNLAIALSRAGSRVGILDADIYGPSIPLMMGNHAPIEMVDNHYIPQKSHGIAAMSIGYLTNTDQALIWRGPMLAKSLLHMIDYTNWGELDYLIIDLPPGTGDIQLSLVQKIPLTAAIVVTTPQQIATLDAEKAIQLFEKTNITVLGLIENMAAHQCSHCGHIEAIFGQDGAKTLSKTHNIPLMGSIPLDKTIQEQCDKGHPSALENSPLSQLYLKIALKLAIALAKRPLNYTDAFPNIVVEKE